MPGTGWIAARERLAIGLSFLRGRETRNGFLGITLETALASELRRLDSSDDGSLQTQSEPPKYTDLPTGFQKGELQRIQEIRATLLGDNGLIEFLKTTLINT